MSASSRIFSRAVAWARRRGQQVRGHNPWVVALWTVRGARLQRVGGLAAEMAFFALLSFVPLVVAIGAGLGYLERFVGAEEILRTEQAAIDALRVVFAADVVSPLVRGLLRQERGGLAVGSALVTLWLASRVFTATIRSLDRAYGVEERRPAPTQRLLAVVFAVGSIVVVLMTLAIMVVGPLLGGGRVLAERFGLGPAFATLWAVGRWPVLAVIAVGFLMLLYRFGPGVRSRLRDCLPGAVLGLALLLVVTAALRLYLAVGWQPTGRVAFDDEAVAVAGQFLGAVVAAVVWVYLSSAAVLLGGVLNAQMSRARRAAGPDGRLPDAGGTMPAP